ncbi:Uncharacterized protein HZ326_30937, partial [Fusarium oxysporum f. sp. albedinis]
MLERFLYSLPPRGTSLLLILAELPSSSVSHLVHPAYHRHKGAFTFKRSSRPYILGETPRREKPKAARTLLCGQGSRLVPRSPGKLCTVSTQRFGLEVSASETDCQSLVVFQAAAEAANKKKVAGQYATAEIGQAASELQKGQRNLVGSVRQGRGHQRAQKVEQPEAVCVVRAAKAAVVGRGSVKLQAKRVPRKIFYRREL